MNSREVGSLHGTKLGPLCVAGICIVWSVWGGLDWKTRVYFWYMSWPFELCSLWWDVLLNFDAWRRGLVLPQLSVTGFVDSLFKALLSLRIGWRIGSGKNERHEEGSKRELWLVCNMNKKIKIKKNSKEMVLYYCKDKYRKHFVLLSLCSMQSKDRSQVLLVQILYHQTFSVVSM